MFNLFKQKVPKPIEPKPEIKPSGLYCKFPRDTSEHYPNTTSSKNRYSHEALIPNPPSESTYYSHMGQ